MELRQGQIIQNKQELSSFFMTHRLNVMHASVKFHKYIPYSLGVMAQTRFTIGTKSRQIIQKWFRSYGPDTNRDGHTYGTDRGNT